MIKVKHLVSVVVATGAIFSSNGMLFADDAVSLKGASQRPVVEMNALHTKRIGSQSIIEMNGLQTKRIGSQPVIEMNVLQTRRYR